MSKEVLTVKASGSFECVIDTIASDKSISHRSALFSLLSDQVSTISNYLLAEDTLCSLSIVEALGAKVERNGSEVTIHPNDKIQEPSDVLNCGNSGTAMRLFTGFLAGQEGYFILTGDKYLCRRPMKRVVDPLRSIGAIIDGRANGNLAPLTIRGSSLKPFDYKSSISSAQVKSALILAGLTAQGESSFQEPELSRDHSERMLRGMGANISSEKGIIKICPLKGKLSGLTMRVPADPSSAFFFAVAAAIVPDAKVVLHDVLLNPTRIEAFKILERMGAKIAYDVTQSQYETIGTITVENAPLHGIEVSENISWLIDELPALSIAMAVAKGKSVVRNAEELRVKESDRITTVMKGLNACGIQTSEFPDGYEIIGGTLSHAVIDSHGDHRIAMSFLIAGLLCDMEVHDTECIQTSFPNFHTILSQFAEVTRRDD